MQSTRWNQEKLQDPKVKNTKVVALVKSSYRILFFICIFLLVRWLGTCLTSADDRWDPIDQCAFSANHEFNLDLMDFCCMHGRYLWSKNFLPHYSRVLMGCAIPNKSGFMRDMNYFCFWNVKNSPYEPPLNESEYDVSNRAFWNDVKLLNLNKPSHYH